MEERRRDEMVIQRLEEMAKRLEDLEQLVRILFGDKVESYHKEPLSKS